MSVSKKTKLPIYIVSRYRRGKLMKLLEIIREQAQIDVEYELYENIVGFTDYTGGI